MYDSLKQSVLTFISSHFRSTTFCPAFGCHVGKVMVALECGKIMSGSKVDETGRICLGASDSVHPETGGL